MSRGAYDVAIIGGGPAGSSLAAELARAGRRVILFEKEPMPRDKLCGEFLSTEVAGICTRLGVHDRMLGSGAQPIRQVRCSAPDGIELNVQLPGTAYGLSRRAFDQILFTHAADSGADVRDGTSVAAIKGALEHGFELDADQTRYAARLVVGAYGRRATLDRKLERPSLRTGRPLVAFKAHHNGALSEHQVELHTFDGGYCGLLVAEDKLTNVCWIAHERHLKEAGGSPESLVDRIAAWNSRLGRRMADLARVEPFQAVSRLDFRRKELFAQDVLLIGDAAGMIAPLCGDGIGMALQSALLAAPLIEEFLDGRSTAPRLKRRYELAWRREFRTRMHVGRLLQNFFVRPQLLGPGLRLAAAFPQVAQRFVTLTRG